MGSAPADKEDDSDYIRFAISHLDVIYYLTSKSRAVDLCLSLKFAQRDCLLRALVRILLSYAAASIHVHASGWAVPVIFWGHVPSHGLRFRCWAFALEFKKTESSLLAVLTRLGSDT